MFKKKLLILFYVLIAVLMFRIPVFAAEDQLPDKPITNIYEIGRASCRERVS